MSELFQIFAGKHLNVSEGLDAHLRKTFPGMDLHEQYLFADLWMEANPRRRSKNQARFLANWLTKEFRKNPLYRPKRWDAGTGPKASDHGVFVKQAILDREGAK